jgi:hypothetical protein
MDRPAGSKWASILQDRVYPLSTVYHRSYNTLWLKGEKIENKET